MVSTDENSDMSVNGLEVRGIRTIPPAQALEAVFWDNRFRNWTLIGGFLRDLKECGHTKEFNAWVQGLGDDAAAAMTLDVETRCHAASLRYPMLNPWRIDEESGLIEPDCCGDSEGSRDNEISTGPRCRRFDARL